MNIVDWTYTVKGTKLRVRQPGSIKLIEGKKVEKFQRDYFEPGIFRDDWKKRYAGPGEAWFDEDTNDFYYVDEYGDYRMIPCYHVGEISFDN